MGFLRKPDIGDDMTAFDKLNFSKLGSRWIRITPTLAQKILDERNYDDNRTVSNSWVAHLARQMTLGLWKKNAETVIFDTTGHMLNGQHRLTAVIKSKTAQTFLIATGVDQETFTTMDQNRSRSAGSVFGMKDIKYGHTVAAICRRIAMWGANGSLRKNVKWSPDELLSIFEKNKSVADSAITGRTVSTKVPVEASMVGFCHFLFSQGRPQKAMEFFEILETGVATSKRCPAFALRERLIKEALQQRRWDVMELFSIFVRSWNSHEKGEKKTTLSLRRNADGKVVVPLIRGLGKGQGNKGK